MCARRKKVLHAVKADLWMSWVGHLGCIEQDICWICHVLLEAIP